MKRIKRILTMLTLSVMFFCSNINVFADADASSKHTVNNVNVRCTANITTKTAKASTSSITGVVCKVDATVYYVNTSTNKTGTQGISAKGNSAASFTYSANNYSALYKMTGKHTAYISSSTFTHSLKVTID